MNELQDVCFFYQIRTTFLLKNCLILMFLMNALPTNRPTNGHSLSQRCEDASKKSSKPGYAIYKQLPVVLGTLKKIVGFILNYVVLFGSVLYFCGIIEDQIPITPNHFGIIPYQIVYHTQLYHSKVAIMCQTKNIFHFDVHSKYNLTYMKIMISFS